MGSWLKGKSESDKKSRAVGGAKRPSAASSFHSSDHSLKCGSEVKGMKTSEEPSSRINDVSQTTAQEEIGDSIYKTRINKTSNG